MKVLNTHERRISAAFEDVGSLMDTLSSREDKLWPFEKWPAMKFDKPLQVGAGGGHGPIRYFVKSYNPGRCVFFEFTAPSGFKGFHGYSVDYNESGELILKHLLEMKTSGTAVLSWPFVFAPLHNALIEDSFDKAERSLGLKSTGPMWNLWVRILRWIFKKIS